MQLQSIDAFLSSFDKEATLTGNQSDILKSDKYANEFSMKEILVNIKEGWLFTPTHIKELKSAQSLVITYEKGPLQIHILAIMLFPRIFKIDGVVVRNTTVPSKDVLYKRRYEDEENGRFVFRR